MPFDPLPERPDAASLEELLSRESVHPDDFQPLADSLLRRYGVTPDLRQDLRSEIHYRLRKLCRATAHPSEAPVREAVARCLARGIHEYVRSYWRPAAEPGPEPPDAARAAVRAALPVALARLPHRQRMAVVWHYFEGRAVAEIADWLETSPDRVSSLLQQAVVALREAARAAPTPE